MLRDLQGTNQFMKGSRTNAGDQNIGVDKRRSVKILIYLSISIQIRLGQDINVQRSPPQGLGISKTYCLK